MKKFSRTLPFLLAAFFMFAWGASASAYDLYVNSSNTTDTEDGTEANPFNTISEATTAATSLSGEPSILIKNGTYAERVNIESPLSLVGESKDGVIIDASGRDRGISVEAKAFIKNLTVKKGYSSIYIAENSGAKIEDVTIKESKKNGIEIKKGSTGNSTKVTLKDSEISESEGKGMYIQKRKVDIQNNTITKNDEEGIDIRAGVSGTIKKNTITKNGESGIELVLGSTKLKITSNTIKNNGASGITNQFYKENKKKGDVAISKNKIRNNDSYGLNCQTPSGGDPIKGYWQKSITLLKNIFSGNDKNYAGVCKFEETQKTTSKK